MILFKLSNDVHNNFINFFKTFYVRQKQHYLINNKSIIHNKRKLFNLTTVNKNFHK